jgi:hypothetical protein
LLRTAPTILTGKVVSATANSVTLSSTASATDGYYNGCWIVLTAGQGAGQQAQVISYIGSTKVATVSPWKTVPAPSTTFSVNQTACGFALDGQTGYSSNNINLWFGTAKFANAKADIGNGTVTNLTATPAAKAGTYTFTAMSPSEFIGSGPSGVLPPLSVGTAYAAGNLSFTLWSGPTPYTVGDKFSISVVPAPAGVRHTITVLSTSFVWINVAPTDTVQPGPVDGPWNLIEVGDSWIEPTMGPSDTPGMTSYLAHLLGFQVNHQGLGSTGWVSEGTSTGRLNYLCRISPPKASIRYLITAKGGTYTLSVTNGGVIQTTVGIPFNASATTVANALNALSNVPKSSKFRKSGAIAVGGGWISGEPYYVCPFGLSAGASVTVNPDALAGGTAIQFPYLGDVAENAPRDSNGNILPFWLLVDGSGNDEGLATSDQVEAAATAAASGSAEDGIVGINELFPQAIAVYSGTESVGLGNGGTGIINAKDLEFESAISTAAESLTRLPNGRIPFIDPLWEGLHGHCLIWGPGNVSKPTPGTNDVLKSVLAPGHPVDGTIFAEWKNAALRTLFGVQ